MRSFQPIRPFPRVPVASVGEVLEPGMVAQDPAGAGR
jgi:hypothetical protein